MRVILTPFLSLLILLTPRFTLAQGEPELKLESVVIVSRHDVRAPTRATQLTQGATPGAWPAQPVRLNWLTPRGDELIAYLGHYQRQCLVADGLPARKGCSQPGQAVVIADVDERARKTDEAFATGLVPNCVIAVHAQTDTSDPGPLFNPLKAGACQLNNASVTDVTLSKAGGSIADFARHRQIAFRELERAFDFPQSNLCLNCEKRDGSCPLTQALPSKLKVSADNVSLTSAVNLASMPTGIFLLQ